MGDGMLRLAQQLSFLTCLIASVAWCAEHPDIVSSNAANSNSVNSNSGDSDANAAKSSDPAALQPLLEWIKRSPDARPALREQTFANQPLSRTQAETARDALWQDRQQRLRRERMEEMKSGVLSDGERKMPFTLKMFGEKPASGRSVYISLHGGGQTSARANNRQWENQKRLYELTEGIYVVPRAPTDSWNMWHQPHIDRLFVRLIENLVIFEDADPNRVYVLGYSAGGDGVYQIAPRLCDRWAAAAMMAGHPNDASPMSLRNVPFALQVGGLDRAFRRNEVAASWGEKLRELQEADPGGYQHLVKVYPKKGHWMDREDRIAIPWMAKFTRNPTPPRIVWRQDDVTTSHCYWLSVESDQQKPRRQVIAEANGNEIDVSSESVSRVTVHLDDRFVDVDQPFTIRFNGDPAFTGRVERTIVNLFDSLERTGDVELSYPASVVVELSSP